MWDLKKIIAVEILQKIARMPSYSKDVNPDVRSLAQRNERIPRQVEKQIQTRSRTSDAVSSSFPTAAPLITAAAAAAAGFSRIHDVIHR